MSALHPFQLVTGWMHLTPDQLAEQMRQSTAQQSSQARPSTSQEQEWMAQSIPYRPLNTTSLQGQFQGPTSNTMSPLVTMSAVQGTQMTPAMPATMNPLALTLGPNQMPLLATTPAVPEIEMTSAMPAAMNPPALTPGPNQIPLLATTPAVPEIRMTSAMPATINPSALTLDSSQMPLLATAPAVPEIGTTSAMAATVNRLALTLDSTRTSLPATMSTAPETTRTSAKPATTKPLALTPNSTGMSLQPAQQFATVQQLNANMLASNARFQTASRPTISPAVQNREIRMTEERYLEFKWQSYLATHNIAHHWSPFETLERDKYAPILSQELQRRRAVDMEQIKNSLNAAILALLSNTHVDAGNARVIDDLGELTEEVRQKLTLPAVGEAATPITPETQNAIKAAVKSNTKAYGDILPKGLEYGPVAYSRAMKVNMAPDNMTPMNLHVATRLTDEPAYFGHRGGDYIFKYTSMHRTDKRDKHRFQYERQVPRTQGEYLDRLQSIMPRVFKMLYSLIMFYPFSRTQPIDTVGWSQTLSDENVLHLRNAYGLKFPSRDTPSRQYRNFIRDRLMATEVVSEFAWLVEETNDSLRDQKARTFADLLVDITGQKDLKTLAGYFTRRQRAIAERILFQDNEYNDRVGVYKCPKTFVEHTRTQHPDAVTDPLANLYSGLSNPTLIFKDSLERVYEKVRGSTADRSRPAPNGPKNDVSQPEVASRSGPLPAASDSQPAASVSQPVESVCQPADSSTAQLSSANPNQSDDSNALLTVPDPEEVPALDEEIDSLPSSSGSAPEVEGFNPNNFLNLGTDTTSDDLGVDFDPLVFDFDAFLQSDSATNFVINASAVPATSSDPPAPTSNLTTDQHPLQLDPEAYLHLPEIPATDSFQLTITGCPSQDSAPQTANLQESQGDPAANIIDYITPLVSFNCDNLQSPRGTKRPLHEFLGKKD